MMQAIRALMSSKKFLATLAGIVVTVLSKFTWAQDLSPETVLGIITGLLGIFGLSQGVADHGKEAAKIATGDPPQPA
jgi:hypothetical protein